MSDSLIGLVGGGELNNPTGIIEQVLDQVEQRHIEYFKSQRSMFDDEEYLRIRECFWVQTFPPSSSGSGFQLDFRVGAMRTVPDEIANDLNNSLVIALDRYR